MLPRLHERRCEALWVAPRHETAGDIQDDGNSDFQRGAGPSARARTCGECALVAHPRTKAITNSSPVQRRFSVRAGYSPRTSQYQAMAIIHRLQRASRHTSRSGVCHGTCMYPTASVLQAVETGRSSLSHLPRTPRLIRIVSWFPNKACRKAKSRRVFRRVSKSKRSLREGTDPAEQDASNLGNVPQISNQAASRDCGAQNLRPSIASAAYNATQPNLGFVSAVCKLGGRRYCGQGVETVHAGSP